VRKGKSKRKGRTAISYKKAVHFFCHFSRTKSENSGGAAARKK